MMTLKNKVRKLFNNTTNLVKRPLCEHDYKYISYGNAVPTELLRCTKCQHEERDYITVQAFVNSCIHDWDKESSTITQTCRTCGYTTWNYEAKAKREQEWMEALQHRFK